SQTSIFSSCESLRVPVVVTINELSPLETIAFQYESNQYCITGNTILPELSIITPLGGTFSVSGGLPINAQTGEINLAEMVEGTYTVTYTLPEDVENCIAESSGTFELIFITTQTVSTGLSYPTPVCKLGVHLCREYEGFASGGFFESTEGRIIDSAIGEINVSLSQPGVYTGVYSVLEDLDR